MVALTEATNSGVPSALLGKSYQVLPGALTLFHTLPSDRKSLLLLPPTTHSQLMTGKKKPSEGSPVNLSLTICV